MNRAEQISKELKELGNTVESAKVEIKRLQAEKRKAEKLIIKLNEELEALGKGQMSLF